MSKSQTSGERCGWGVKGVLTEPRRWDGGAWSVEGGMVGLGFSERVVKLEFGLAMGEEIGTSIGTAKLVEAIGHHHTS